MTGKFLVTVKLDIGFNIDDFCVLISNFGW